MWKTVGDPSAANVYDTTVGCSAAVWPRARCAVVADCCGTDSVLRVFARRYAGRSFESVSAAEAGEGSLLVKGVRAVWRQSAPYVQNTLMVSSCS
jgi:hypothetical protein